VSQSLTGVSKTLSTLSGAWMPGKADQYGLASKTDVLKGRVANTSSLWQSLARLGSEHVATISKTYGSAARENLAAWQTIWSQMRPPQTLGQDYYAYAVDAAQRSILFLDVMRQVGNQFVDQQSNGNSPVLVYEYTTIMDGRQQQPAVNYALLHIHPPAGVEVDPDKRPYMIIDPRAGHGPGIGGFKNDSQVGVALAHGHAVYFVIFFQQPEPGQTMADVCALEGRFFREVARRHPNAPTPVTVGNCQGGWAAMLLAASNPHVTGPVVVNGAPLSYWSGVRGKNPMRYLGGLTGGAVHALIASDLGNGRFDGAHLVMNFEKGNPGNTWWSKYYNVFANVDTEAERFIGFERWWSGFYIMNEAEIRWIVENLFVGNKLEQGTAVLGGRGPVDLRTIKAPIIVFASHGDDITPPQQALNWISHLYADEREIRARGQRIIYMIHKDIGHLGIFVSAKVALKEHDRIIGTLEAIEALAPGLYEMKIEQQIGEGIHAEYVVGFAERTVADLRALDDGDDETPFAVVDRISRFGVDVYELTARPAVRAMATPALAETLVQTHPLRARRYMVSDLNPAVKAVAAYAPAVREARSPVAPGNPFFETEKLFAAIVEQGMNFWRDVKTMTDELTFFSIYANPFLAPLVEARALIPNARVGESLRELPQVQAALVNLIRGGYAEAVIRMLILMAKARGSVRQSRLERSNAILHSSEPFKSMGDSARSHVINEQSLIVEYEPDQAVATLPKLLATAEERTRAIGLVEQIAGDVAEMNEPTIRMLGRLRETLSLPPLVTPNGTVPQLAAPVAEQPEPAQAAPKSSRTGSEKKAAATPAE
jgi:pimeloyl-ACP methyl ester carboxylesterase/tellurite resistance protein